MKNYWTLTRLMLKTTLASLNPFTGMYEDAKKKKQAVFKMLGMAVLLLYVIGFVVFLEIKIFNLLNDPARLLTGEANTGLMPKNTLMLPGLAIMISMAFTLILGLFQGLSELYQGKDAPFLATLPLTSRQVFAARFTSLYVTELLLNLLLCVPAFILYGIREGAFPTALTALPVLIFLPAIPLCVVCLVAALLMRISVFAKHRDSIVLILTFAIAIGYGVGVSWINSKNGGITENLAIIFTKENGMVHNMLRILPPAQWATDGFGGSISSLLLFLGVSLLGIALVVKLVGPSYVEHCLAAGEQTVTGKGSKTASRMRQGSTLKALHILEWKRVLRTPVWLYNGLAGVVMFPLMIGIGTFFGVSNSEAAGGMGGLRQALEGVDPMYIVLFGTALLAMASMVNPVVCTAISREGENWPHTLSLPVRQRTRFTAKLLVGVELDLITTLLIGAVATFLVGVNMLPAILGAVVLASIFDVGCAAIGLWLDAKHPRMKWVNETQAIKQNANQLLGMLLWFGFLALCVLPIIPAWRLGINACVGVLLLMVCLECGLSLLLLYRAADLMGSMDN